MGIFYEKKEYVIAAAAAICISLMMILFSDIAVVSAKKGISLWISSVVPAMLPFFICVNFMTGIGLIEMLPASIFPFAMSALSGYPMGAKVVGDMCMRGMIDKREAMRLMSFCSTSGPVFMIGAVGIGMLYSQTAGIVIAVSHYLGAVLNGVLFTILLKGSRKCDNRKTAGKDRELMEELTKAVLASFKSMAVILAYIIFFMFTIDMIAVLGITGTGAAASLLNGFIEMTVGCSSLSSAEMTLRQSSTLASVIISWGGLSILGQSMSMLGGTGIPAGYIVLTKLTHSLFAGIISLFIGTLML